MTKKVVCFGNVILAFGPCLGFFWPSEGLHPSEGQKIPKTGRRSKWPCQSTKLFFVIPNDEKCRALTYELHFSTLSKFFPLQKVNFPELKIPLGWIYFLSLFARKTRTRARMKKRAKGRKSELIGISYVPIGVVCSENIEDKVVEIQFCMRMGINL